MLFIFLFYRIMDLIFYYQLNRFMAKIKFCRLNFFAYICNNENNANKFDY
nr:MAG TPA: hypothetical protein [Bacteriophage sp.]